MSNNEELYVKGFNNGYILAKYAPGIYSTLETGIQPKTDYLEGFISGGKEYGIEKNSPQKNLDKGKYKNRDIERDR